MSQWQGIGVMSGTSLDGVDIALCSFAYDEEARWHGQIDLAETISMPPRWQAQLRALPQGSAAQYASLHAELGHFLGSEIAGFIRRHGVNPQFVASHGQTIFHQPEAGFTSQIGDGEMIAAHLEVPVVTNFRAKDVALGGQGAPLVPFGERYLFGQFTYCLNLGGFANLSHGGVAFDVCPCNLPINLIAAEAGLPDGIDRDGATARAGKPIEALQRALLALPYYQRSGPRSLGTEWLDAEFLPLVRRHSGSHSDLLHTLTEHVASLVATSVATIGAPGELLVTGGGAHNRFLMELLTNRLQPLGVSMVQVPPVLIDFKEAYVFAFLGLMTLLGQTNTLNSVTGAVRDVCGGSIHLPPGGGYSLL
jgi:anhydro-N-acetylmuramic acid kinase